MIDKMRDEFERAFMSRFDTDLPAWVWLERRPNGEYASLNTSNAWWGWQESRKSIEVDLPPFRDSSSAYFGDECYDGDQLREAIESLGLKVI